MVTAPSEKSAGRPKPQGLRDLDRSRRGSLALAWELQAAQVKTLMNGAVWASTATWGCQLGRVAQPSASLSPSMTWAQYKALRCSVSQLPGAQLPRCSLLGMGGGGGCW